MKEQFKGTWLYIKSPDYYGKNSIIEFSEDEIRHFNIENNNGFSLLKKVEEDWNEKLSESEYQFINSNRIRFFRNGKKYTVLSEEKSITEDWKFENDYEKLNSTETNLTQSQIESVMFMFEWHGEKRNIKFNEVLDSPVIQEINKRLNKEGSKVVLENLNETLFLSFYSNGHSERLIPIKYVDNKIMILYGFPKEPYEIECKIIENKAIPIMGTYVNDLVEIKKNGILKARKIELE